MRVLHVVPSLALRHGGVSTSVRELCRDLSSLGVDVRICTTTRGYDPVVDGPADELLRSAGVEIRYFPVSPLRILGQRYAYSPALGTALHEEVPRADLVHLHALWMYPIQAAARECRRYQVPYILSPCGALDPYSMRVRRIFKFLYGFLIQRRTLKKAAMIHFTSSMEQSLAFTFGIRWRSAVIPCSIRLEPVPPPPTGSFRSKYPEVAHRRILLFLGRLHAKKRLDLVANAFIAVSRRIEDVHLVVAGPDEGAGSRVREMLKQAKLLDRVTFTGLWTGLYKGTALRSSILFLLPSEEENFGVTILEAMAAHLPVLISPHVGLGPEIQRSQAGMILELRHEKWVEAIELLLNNPETAHAMGEAGFKLTETTFSHRRVSGAMRDAYLTILQGGSA